MNDKKVIIGIALAVAALLDLLVIVGLQISHFSVQEGQMKQLRTDIASAERESALRDPLLREKSQIEEELSVMQTRFLRKDDVSYLLAQVNQASKREKIELQSTRLLKQETVGGGSGITFYYLPVAVSMRTDYHRLGRFLNELERQAVPIRIKEMTLSGETPQIQIEAELIGVARGE